ncbi:MAG: hypothetical protein V7711_16010 [Pseudomonadales bacterium]
MSVVRKIVMLSLCSALMTVLVACSGSTSTESGIRTGVLIGGLVDGWEGAATGAILGGAAGLAVDHSEDKKERQRMAEREAAERSRLRQSAITADAATAYRPKPSNPLVGSTWRMISYVNDDDAAVQFKSLLITFSTNSRATTLLIDKEGNDETYTERYQVVGDALVFTGKDYVTNTQYSVSDKQMVVVAPGIRVVLEEIEDSL